jgi:hypothetical protein
MKGLISNTLDWLTHPTYSDASLGTWAAFLTLVLVGSFLWTTTLKQVTE